MTASSFLSSLRGKKTLILTHAGADVDSFCAAAALYLAFHKHAEPVIGVPEHINLSAQALAQNLGLAFVLSPKNLEDYDRLIVVDCNSFDMLGGLAEAVKAFKKPILVIDHHADGRERISTKALRLIDPSCVSTCELIYRLLAGKHRHLTPMVATLIAAGIIVASAGFTVANPETFIIMSRMLERAGKKLPEIVSLLKVRTDISEKIALLKAAKRVRIFRSAQDRLLCCTEVNSFEASCASSLIRLGADVAFAGGSARGHAVISARANNHLVVKTGFDLAGHVFRRMEAEFGGSGGGHPAAAAYNLPLKEDGSTAMDKLLKRCVDFAHEFFRGKVKQPGLALKEYD